MTPLDIPTLRSLAVAARERADKATAGPWMQSDDRRGTAVVDGTRSITVCRHGADRVTSRENAAFVAASRTDVPALADALVAALDEVERLRKVEAAARELVIWDWLHLLCDGEHADVVRDDVDALGMALAKYDAEKRP